MPLTTTVKKAAPRMWNAVMTTNAIQVIKINIFVLIHLPTASSFNDSINPRTYTQTETLRGTTGEGGILKRCYKLSIDSL